MGEAGSGRGRVGGAAGATATVDMPRLLRDELREGGELVRACES